MIKYYGVKIIIFNSLTIKGDGSLLKISFFPTFAA